jgi:hypothetical protein
VQLLVLSTEAVTVTVAPGTGHSAAVTGLPPIV